MLSRRVGHEACDRAVEGTADLGQTQEVAVMEGCGIRGTLATSREGIPRAEGLEIILRLCLTFYLH